METVLVVPGVAAICGTALWLWHLARDSRQGAVDLCGVAVVVSGGI